MLSPNSLRSFLYSNRTATHTYNIFWGVISVASTCMQPLQYATLGLLWQPWATGKYPESLQPPRVPINQ